MKKIFLLLAVVALVSSMGSVRTASATKVKAVSIAGRGAPEAVLNTYNQIVTDYMNFYFPSNPNWDDSNVSWNKEKTEWIASGMIMQVGGNGSGIQIHSARFLSTGDFIEVLYTVIP